MKETEIADLFEEISDLLELHGENPFRIQAYRRAALNLRNLSEDLEELAAQGRLQEIPGVGKDLAQKIQEFLKTGKLRFLEGLEKKTPQGLSLLVGIPGVGPKTAKLIYDRFRVQSLRQLKTLVQAGKIRTLPGLRQKKEENILRGIELLEKGQERMPLGVALGLGRELLKSLEGSPLQRIELAGSLRRRKETVRDIDILVTSSQPKKIMDRFVSLKFVAQIQAHGPTKSSIRTSSGVQVDLRVVEPDSFGAALVYFTGSKEHNIKIRSMANRIGLTINEYGVFRIKTNRKVAAKEEKDLYRVLGLPWIPPELREDLGEIEAAKAGRLPHLVEQKDLLGAFHNHTNRTDGHHPLEELALSIQRAGYRYMLLSDHSKSLRVARGLTESELLAEKKEVDRLNQRLAPFRILMGAEVDILPDGRMDYPDRLLSQLDLVIGAVHSAFKQPQEVMTQRILKALRNPHVDILAHPTGRLLGQREPYSVDMDRVISAAAQQGTALEINSYPRRMDLNDAHARKAREEKVKLVISLDTHTLSQLPDVELGLAMARRAWVSPQELLNTLTVQELLNWAATRSKS